jgi:predicted transcriptional regulator
MTGAKVRMAMAAMGQPETKNADLCRELGITRQTIYRHVAPNGELRDDGRKLLSRAQNGVRAQKKRPVETNRGAFS